MKNRQKGRFSETIPLIEEVFATAQRLPMSAWSVYYSVTFAFVLGLLYFWFDMANHTFAYERLSLGAAGLTVLFIVMKTGHVYFLRCVTEEVSGEEFSVRPRLSGVVSNQTIVQTTGLLLLPLAIVFVVPFAHLYAFYQNVSVLDDGRRTLRELMSEARVQAGLNQRQNHIMLWLLSPHVVVVAVVFYLVLMPIMRMTTPVWTDYYVFLYAFVGTVVVLPLCPFGILVTVNIGATLVMIPSLLKTLLGIESVFTVGSGFAGSPSFFVVVSGLTFLCLDPLVTIGYSVRCFRGASVHSGKDLKVGLSRLRGAAGFLVVILAGVLCGSASGQESSAGGGGLSAERLSQSIDETMQDRKFAWRFPRERPESSEDGFLASFNRMFRDSFEWVGKKIRMIIDSVRNLGDDPNSNRGSPGFLGGDSMKGIAFVLLIVLLGILLFVGVKAWRKRQIVEVVATPVHAVVPDLENESTTADELPSAEWLRLGRDLLEKGDIRLAMRAYFFAGLAQLAFRRLILLAAHKSNREYMLELARISHANADLFESFRGNLGVFESVWYGDHTVSETDLEEYIERQQRISHHV
jgi:hypothetical protein